MFLFQLVQSLFDSEKESAVRAKQHISLCSHGQSEPWVPVLEGLRNIRQLVHNSLTRGVSRRVEPEASRDDDIYVSRRVFSKVCVSKLVKVI